MAYLVDTNVLIRLIDSTDEQHRLATAAVEHLVALEETLYISSQILVEVWAAGIRPRAVNGFGWSTEIAASAIRGFCRQFPMLPDAPETLDCWLELVERCGVSGKHTHDAKLAALAIVHRVPNILTYNTSDFPSSWGIEAIHPASLAE